MEGHFTSCNDDFESSPCLGAFKIRDFQLLFHPVGVWNKVCDRFCLQIDHLLKSGIPLTVQKLEWIARLVLTWLQDTNSN